MKIKKKKIKEVREKACGYSKYIKEAHFLENAKFWTVVFIDLYIYI